MSSRRGRGDGGRGRGDGGRGRGDGGRGRGDGGRGRGDRGRGRGFDVSHPMFKANLTPDPPLSTVHNLENEILANQREAKLPVSALNLACRPGYGSNGRTITLRTNFFEMQYRGVTCAKYVVSIEPLKDNNGQDIPIRRRTRTRIFELLLERPTFNNAIKNLATDYASTIISAARLPLGEKDKKTSTIDHFEKEDESRRQTYNVTVELTGYLNEQIPALRNYLRNSEASPEYSQESKADTVQSLNIIKSKKPIEAKDVVCYGQNKFYNLKNEASSLKNGLIAIRGYYASVRTSTGRILVNVNVCTSPFYEEGGLQSLVNKYLTDGSRPSIPELARFLRGVKVKTTYTPKPKFKTIWGLAKSPRLGANARDHTFRVDEYGKDMTVEDFFKKKHRITLLHPTMPLVNVGNEQKPCLLPPEVCFVPAGQRHRGALLPNQTALMVKVACRVPWQNGDDIVGPGARLMGFDSSDANPLGTFGVRVPPTMITVPGRILSPPTLQYKNENLKPSDGGWIPSNQKFFTPAAVKNWSYMILVDGQRTQVDALRQAIRALKQTFERVGMEAQASNPPNGYTATVVPVRGNDDEKQTAYDANMRNIESQFMAARDNRVKLLIVLLHSENADIYARIKFFGDVKYGILTVCCQANKILSDKGAHIYRSNVALKVNLKLGGINQALVQGQLGIIGDNKTIVFGIDVTHPSPDSQEEAPSVAGVVSSLNARCGQWPASLMIQKGRVEMVAQLAQMVKDRLALWKKKNGTLPDKILVYRDGVSEGQYELVLREEYPAIAKACEQAQCPNPKISIVICGKRHHTRFYPVKNQECDKLGNPLNGTVVDRGVIREREWGFFLQAHRPLHGTARPCNYAIIKDEIGLGADSIEQLTHNLSYMFGRSTTAVSLCSPAYFADLLCERGRQYLRRAFFSGSRGEKFNIETAEWTGGVHQAVAESMFYI